MSTRNRPPIVAVVAVAVIAVALVAVIGCTTSDPETAEPAAAPSEADIGFARDMAAHHAQAVDMAERIRSRTADPRLRSLATDIVLTQQAQIGRMQGWLELWGEPLTSTAPPMAWADDDSDGEGMDHDVGWGTARWRPCRAWRARPTSRSSTRSSCPLRSDGSSN